MAAASALILLWVASMLFGGAPFAPQALAERFLRATPGDVATFFIETFGHWARRLLTFGALLVTGWLGASALAWLRDDDGPKFNVTAAILGTLAAAASFLSPSIDASLIPVALSSAAAAFLYSRIARSIHTSLTHEDTPDEGRRRALKVGIGATLGLGLGGGALGWVASRLSGPNTDVELVAPATPAAPPPGRNFPDIPGLSPEVTTPRDHYVVDINLVQPSVDADGWSLRVHGNVAEEREFTFPALQSSFDVVEEYVTLACVSNEVGGDLIGNSAWGGVRLKDVIESAGPDDGAVDVIFRAADGYSDSITLEQALDPSVLVAVSQNGMPLSQEHGFPCRIRIPQIYGMKNVKWIEEIEIVDSDYEGYWQQRGWSDEAIVRTQSRIDVAGDDRDAKVGVETWVAGVAWSGGRGISKVEVSTDDGATWNEAMVKEPLSPYSWSQWAYRWTPEREGSTGVLCRATDGTGETQPEHETPPHPDGAAGWHRVAVSVDA